MKKFFLLIIITFSILLVGCNVNQNPIIDDYIILEDKGLLTVENADQLSKLIKKSNNILYENDVMFATSDDARTETAPTNQTPSTNYTKTNVQVEGIDEGDIIKTDGSRIYSIASTKLEVIQLLGNGKMEVLYSEKLTSDLKDDNYVHYSYFSELYVTDKYLIVIGQKYSYNYVYLNKKQSDTITIQPTISIIYNYSIMSIIKIYNKDSLEKIDEYETSGNLNGSRLIENKLYLISNYRISNYNKKDDFDIRPWYNHNGEISYYNYENIQYIPNNNIFQAFTTITTVNLDDEISYTNKVFLSTNNWSNIYVSENSIYLASTYYDVTILNKLIHKGIIISFQIDDKTGKLYYGGYGEYKGGILNQFAIDEYNGYLRIATIEGFGNDIKNRLYVFKRILKNDAYVLAEVSMLDSGLGKPGERIQSVRFNKDIATIVTFLQTDPLYTIDLSDPYKPIIKGALEIPGFSSYQHPWEDNLVVGIGYETNNLGITIGIKIALYDITDVNDPKELGKPLVLDYGVMGYSYTDATLNHKAIMIDKSNNYLGFALRRFNFNKTPSAINEYLIMEVDKNSNEPIKIKYTVSHDDYYTKYPYIFNKYYGYFDFTMKRAFRVDDYIYIISGEVITSYNLKSNFALTDEIIFEK